MQTYSFQDRISRFSTLYMQVERLSRSLKQSTQDANWETISFFSRVLKDKSYSGQKCAYFLYRQAAMGLKSIIARSENREIVEAACSTLRSFSLQNMDNGCFATSQALGTLPLNLKGPKVPELPWQIQDSVTCRQIIDKAGIVPDQGRWLGRSLVYRDQNSENLLVLKLARENDCREDLLKEASWIKYLQEHYSEFSQRFDLPQIILVQDSPICSLDFTTLPCCCNFTPHPQGVTLAYLVHSDYFLYPNDPATVHKFSSEDWVEILSRNSYLLGRLSSEGILHTAPIALFHNRVQEYRRDDSGSYIWTRAGRLDRWYHSCLFPNLGVSGLRDFEHLKTHSGSAQELFRVMGEHFLSLLLIAASCFRSLRPEKMGLDENNTPVDARDLFDSDLLEQMIRTIFSSYYQGFVGSNFFQKPALQNVGALAKRMIEEMGVDNNMQEILRVEDQFSMSEQEFIAFLTSRGMERDAAQRRSKGIGEISLSTGPHLGGFNQRFSLPELTDFVSGASAACVLDKFLLSKG
mgnify:CR=1 FL=1